MAQNLGVGKSEVRIYGFLKCQTVSSYLTMYSNHCDFYIVCFGHILKLTWIVSIYSDWSDVSIGLPDEIPWILKHGFISDVSLFPETNAVFSLVS